MVEDHPFNRFNPRRILLILLVAGNAAAQTSTFPSSWQVFHGNRQHTGQSAVNGPSTNTLRWKYTAADIGNTSFNTMTVDHNGNVYVNGGGKLWVLNSAGQVVWSANIQATGATALSPDESTVYSVASATLYALNASSGQVRWTYAASDPALPIYGEPNIASDGTIYFGSWDKYVYALTPNGTLKWKYQTDGSIAPLASPTLSPDERAIYVGTGDPNKFPGGSLFAINSDGTLAWSKKIDNLRVSGVVVGADGKVYANSQGRVHCYMPNGTLVWDSVDGTAGSLAPSLSSDGTIFTGTSQDGKIYGLEASTGRTKWSFQTGTNPNFNPSNIHAPQYGVLATPVIGADNTAYIGAIDGVMYALKSNGTLVWKYQTGSSIHEESPALGPDGTLYFGSEDKYLYAIKDSTSGGTAFTVPNRGGTSLTTAGTGASVSTGYARIQPNSGSTTPSGVAIFGFRQNNILVSETGVPASLPLTSGRIYAEIGGAVDTGIAIANPNNSAVTINFFFTDAAGNDLGSGTTPIAANAQSAKFLDQTPYGRAAPFQGTFSFSSSLPVAVIALRGFTNERGEFLMSTLPVIDAAAAAASGTQVLPDYADGGGWTTQILLVNPTSAALTGNVQFSNPDGTPASVTIAGQTGSSFPYFVPARSSQKLVTSGTAATTAAGSVRVVPAGATAPTPLVVFSYKPAEITVSEAGVPVTSGTALRMYVESSGTSGQPGNIQSGVAVANTSSSNATITFELTQLDGTSVTGLAPVSIPLAGSGQTAKFLAGIFPTLPNPFKGVLRISTTSSGISVVGLRTRYNERSEFLVTTTPPTIENAPSTSAEMAFPHLADGGGYTTQFILFSGTAGQSAAGTLRFFDATGQIISPIR